MNIGLFTDTYFPQVSGVSTSIKSLRDELIRQGHRVLIFTTTDPDADDRDQEGIIRLPSIPFVSFDDRRIAYSGFEKALKIAKKYQIDIVHTHTEFSLGLSGLYVASRMKIPVIHTYHTLYEKYTHYILDGDLIQARHVGALSKLFCNQVDGVISPSTMTQEKLRSYGIKTQIRVIPTGVLIPDSHDQAVAKLRDQLGLSREEQIFLSLSRLSKEKSIDKVIEAYAKMAPHLSNSRLLVVGDGPARPDLEQQARNLGVPVTFIGEVNHDQVSDYYQLSDLYLNASESETQGLTYLEAFANRLPIIAKRNPYLESLMPDARFGALFDDDHPLDQTALNFLQAMDQGLVESIDQSALDLISVETFANAVLAFYQDALACKKHSRFYVPDIILPRLKNLIRDVVLGPQNPHQGS
ncbi:TPA: glycosyltransferase family 4 protein [Streptococcus suis]